jgi:hypothetical protein
MHSLMLMRKMMWEYVSVLGSHMFMSCERSATSSFDCVHLCGYASALVMVSLYHDMYSCQIYLIVFNTAKY